MWSRSICVSAFVCLCPYVCVGNSILCLHIICEDLSVILFTRAMRHVLNLVGEVWCYRNDCYYYLLSLLLLFLSSFVVQVMMHEPGELPDFTDKGFMASPGFSTVCRVDVRQVNVHKHLAIAPSVEWIGSG